MGDVLITMHPEPDGQRGHCGNFNGDHRDDRAMMDRQAVGRSLGASLSATTEGATSEELVQEDLCTFEARANATTVCNRLCGGQDGGALAATFTQDCIYDVCHGGRDKAISDCVMAWQTQMMIDRTTPVKTKLVGEGCCKPWEQILANIPDLTRNECANARPTLLATLLRLADVAL